MLQMVTCASLREDEELREFFETLVSSYLNSHSQYTRIDILNCPGSSPITHHTQTIALLKDTLAA